jgi:hypothetical protein
MKNDFESNFEKAVQTILDNNQIDLGDNKQLIRSSLKRHVQLLVYTLIDGIINKLVP